MGLHEELKNINPEIIAIAAELTAHPDMPVTAQDSVRAIKEFPALEKMVGVLSSRYVEIAQSSGMDDDYARTMLVGTLLAANTLARCAEIQMLEESVSAE